MSTETKGFMDSGIPATPRTKKVLMLALKRAKEDGYLDTGHLLLAILQEGEGLAARALKDYVSLEQMEQAMADKEISIREETEKKLEAYRKDPSTMTPIEALITQAGMPLSREEICMIRRQAALIDWGKLFQAFEEQFPKKEEG